MRARRAIAAAVLLSTALTAPVLTGTVLAGTAHADGPTCRDRGPVYGSDPWYEMDPCIAWQSDGSLKAMATIYIHTDVRVYVRIDSVPLMRTTPVTPISFTLASRHEYPTDSPYLFTPEMWPGAEDVCYIAEEWMTESGNVYGPAESGRICVV
jgi:hypothetical protein